MNWIKRITIVLFAAMLLVPLATMDLREDVVSEIDNRALAPNPLSGEGTGDLTTDIENYISDRIGFRDEMILGYTVLNDKLFGKMVHPLYSYGKDGYVFAAGLDSVSFGEYHVAFADMVQQVQEYCQQRDIPFLMVFQPAKPAVMQEYIAAGIQYDRSWVDQLMDALEQRGVNVLDNTETLSTYWEAGEAVFNQKYDANHWNDLGAYYGTRAALERMQEIIPQVYITPMEELEISQERKTSLLVSKFPIDELVPKISIAQSYTDNTKLYASELQLHEQHRSFGSYENPQRQAEGAPSALVFQGSYMNGYGLKYFRNAFSEYTYVHDYQNILNLPYYVNIFQPDCVIFEVAEYTLTDYYFSRKGMQNLEFQDAMPAQALELTAIALEKESLLWEQGEGLTCLTWKTDLDVSQVWLAADQVYDLCGQDGAFSVTVKTEDFLSWDGEMSIVLQTTQGEWIRFSGEIVKE